MACGLRAARANLLPGFLVQAAMLGAVLAYYFLPASRPVFDALAEASRRVPAACQAWAEGHSRPGCAAG